MVSISLAKVVYILENEPTAPAERAGTHHTAAVKTDTEKGTRVQKGLRVGGFFVIREDPGVPGRCGRRAWVAGA